MDGGGMAPIIGMMSDEWNNQRQNQNNKNYQNRQYSLNERTAENNQRRAKEMIEFTSPKNMVKRLKDANLSVGMMLGQGGAGGNTSSASGAGEASGVGLPSYTPSQAGFTTGMNNIAELSLIDAQKDALQAQANKTNVEANKIAGVDTENTTADTALTNLKAENQKIMNNVANETQEALIGTAIANYNKAEGEASSAVSAGKYAEESNKAQVYKLQQEGALTAMKISAEKAGIALTEEQTRAISQELAQGWEELYQKGRANDNQKGMVNIAGFKAKLDEILGKANLDLRAKELMVRGAEAFMNGIKGGKSKGSTTETHREPDGTVIQHTTNH